MRKLFSLKRIGFLLAASLLTANANAVLISVYDAEGAMGSLADAQAVIDAAAGPDARAETPDVWFSDVGTDPFGWGAGGPFPGGFDTTFVVSIVGAVDTDFYSHLYLAHDDGVELTVAGATLYEFSTPTDFRESGALYLGAASGMERLQGLYYENFGEADLFLWGYRRDGGGWEKASIKSVPEPGTLALLGLGLFGLGLSRRRKA